MLLVTDFMNFKIKMAQSFGGAHKSRMYIHIFIEVSDYTYINICIYTVFVKEKESKMPPLAGGWPAT
jgi:hypothetical protein